MQALDGEYQEFLGEFHPACKDGEIVPIKMRLMSNLLSHGADVHHADKLVSFAINHKTILHITKCF